MITSIRPAHFFKCQFSIEKSNLKNPSPKILVMDSEYTHRHSHVSGMLLRAYYSKLEKNPALGVSDDELKTYLKNQADGSLFECHYCNTKLSRQSVTIDHFKPKLFHGLNQFFNFRVSCGDCNLAKGGIYPQKMPVTYSVFLKQVQENNKIQCIDILNKVKDESFHLLEKQESQLVERLISIEERWRSAYEAKKAQKQKELKLLKTA